MIFNLGKCVCFNYHVPPKYVVVVCLSISVVILSGIRSSCHFSMDKIVNVAIDTDKENDVCSQNKIFTSQTRKVSWTYKQQRIIVFAFYPGYLITQVPGGILVDHFGGKYILFVALLMSAIMSLVTPAVVSTENYFYSVILRFMTGLAQGPMYSSVYTTLSNWTRRTERSFFTSIVCAGGPLGTAFSDYIANHVSDWTTGYYVLGSVTFVWCVFYISYCYSDPLYHPHVTPEELQDFINEIGEHKQLVVPWNRFFMSLPVWGYFTGVLAVEALYSFYVNLIPEYLYSVLKYDRDGHIRLLPTVSSSLTSVIFGKIADYLVISERMQLVNVRRTMGLIGTLIPAAFLIGIPRFKCDKDWAYRFYFIGVMFLGPADGGIRANVLDITRNVVGFTSGFVGCGGSFVRVFLPRVLKSYVDQDVFYKWGNATVFASLFVVLLFIVYYHTIQSERQEWDFEEIQNLSN